MRKPPIRAAEIQLAGGGRLKLKIAVNPRARAISLRIDPAKREAIATAPTERHIKRALNFAAERAPWIEAELARLPQGAPFAPGATIPFRGAPHRLALIAPRAKPSGEAGVLEIPCPDESLFPARVKRFLIAAVRADLSERVEAHGAHLGVRVTKIAIKEMRSRWGSCSPDGALSFSWRLVFTPPFVLDYLAAHEVAHLREMNHSARFWACVAKLTPHAEAARRWLRANGPRVHAFGASA